MKENKQKEFYIEKVKRLNMKMVYVEGGTFTMGADEQDIYAYDDEKPSHQVSVDSYFIGAYPVTQAQWKAIMGDNPSGFWGFDKEDFPVESVNWHEAQEFCQRLSALTGKKYMLPTEAQWEFAARGGNKSKGTLYPGSNNLEEVGWYDENSDCETHLVGEKRPNELGLYDMAGNVNEWCSDWDESFMFADACKYDGEIKALRGGSYALSSTLCRISIRNACMVDNYYADTGFRVVSIP